MNVTVEQLMAVGMSRPDAESEVWGAALAEAGRRARATGGGRNVTPTGFRFRVEARGRTPGRCSCECASGGFCGGCGHAGCGRR